MIIYVYRKLVPPSMRKRLFASHFVGTILYNLWKRIVLLECRILSWIKFAIKKNELNEAKIFIGKNGPTQYPFPNKLKYEKREIPVYISTESALPYVIHNNNKLYFPESFNENKVREMYRTLITEQDCDSPHKYTDDYMELKDRILLDIGAAEGIFALDAIEYIEKAFLFEYDNSWGKALEKTFSPWKEKVTIIPKFVSSDDSESTIRIDSLGHKLKDKKLFIKMDIEGAEIEALKGAENTLRRNNVHYSICAYHHPNHQKMITAFMKKLNFTASPSKGFMFIGNQFRRGVIRGNNTNPTI